jgi:long-chain acyl-CoA synthetase
MLASAAAAFELSGEDVFLPGSSMSHIGSFLWSLATLAAGGRVVIARSYDSHETGPAPTTSRPSCFASSLPRPGSRSTRDTA